MKHASLGAFLTFDDRPARVVAVANGRDITIEFLDESDCPHCGRSPRVTLLEKSKLFQEHVMPVETVGE